MRAYQKNKLFGISWPSRVMAASCQGNAISNLMERRHIESAPYRIPWGEIKVGLNEVRADVEAEKTPALEWELWLRRKVIGRIPGA